MEIIIKPEVGGSYYIEIVYGIKLYKTALAGNAGSRAFLIASSYKAGLAIETQFTWQPSDLSEHWIFLLNTPVNKAWEKHPFCAGRLMSHGLIPESNSVIRYTSLKPADT
ncbi:MAG: hypothetical protein U5K79_14350 [Cyclobacteriaceae bacterium]|nr:hypothetical protein [Cyclobacteriaceae bacterium]